MQDSKQSAAVQAQLELLALARNDQDFLALLEKPEQRMNLFGPQDSQKAYLLASLAEESARPLALVVADELRARNLEANLKAFIPDTEPKEGEEQPVLDGSVTGEAALGVGGAASPIEGSPETTPEMVPAQDGGEVAAPPPVTPSTQGTGGLY